MSAPAHPPTAPGLDAVGGLELARCTDCDGDGVEPPEDCDDAAPDVHPGRVEVAGTLCADGLDNDCDGAIDAADDACPLPARCGVPATCGGDPFEDVTACAGVDVALHGPLARSYLNGGLAWGDVDGDGWVDLFTANDTGPNRLLRNQRDGTFAPFPFEADVAFPELENGGGVFADFDNDGWQDLYVLANGPDRLLRNLGGAGFADVTAAAGIDEPLMSQSASWGDYDGDGDLDLYVATYTCYTCGRYDPYFGQDALYRNDGDGTFTEVTELLGLDLVVGFTYATTWLDGDGDGDLDLYVANDKGYPRDVDLVPVTRNLYFRNDGPGCGGWCFTEIGRHNGAGITVFSMGIAVGDLENDGDLDMVIPAEETSILVLQPAGFYVDVGATTPIDVHTSGWGAAFLDYDLDGYEDLYAACVLDEPGGTSGVLAHNEGGVLVELEGGGANPDAHSYGVATADVDKDGRVDLAVGAQDGARLYRNTLAGCDGHGWLRVRLVGGGPVNRDAVGSLVRVHRDDGVVLTRHVIAGTSFGSGHELAMTFGLGEAAVRDVVITWPDGRTEHLGAIASNREWTFHYAP